MSRTHSSVIVSPCRSSTVDDAVQCRVFRPSLASLATIALVTMLNRAPRISSGLGSVVNLGSTGLAPSIDFFTYDRIEPLGRFVPRVVLDHVFAACFTQLPPGATREIETFNGLAKGRDVGLPLLMPHRHGDLTFGF